VLPPQIYLRLTAQASSSTDAEAANKLRLCVTLYFITITGETVAALYPYAGVRCATPRPYSVPSGYILSQQQDSL